MTETFTQFCRAANKAKKVPPFCGRLLAIDPGETTGWCLFQGKSRPGGRIDYEMEFCGQIPTWPMKEALNGFEKLLTYGPSHILYEQYRVYEWKADDHSWSSIPTLRIIGCLETLALQRAITPYNQSAQQAKNFCTDERLREWGLYQKGMRHARDSIRHACFFLLFNGAKPPPRE